MHVAGAPCTTGGLPSEFSYLNLGTVKNKGFELGVDGAVNRALNVFANYSYQAEPEPDFALSEINLPPTNRFNAGFNFSQGHFLGNAVGQLRGRCVLPGRARRALRRTDRGLHAGQRRVRREVRCATSCTTTIKVINLLNEDIQSHVFGDILKRQVIGESDVQF